MAGILGLVALVLIFVIIVQLARTNELSNLLKGGGDEYENASRVNAALMLAVLIFSGFAVAYIFYIYTPKLLPEAASIHGKETDKIFNLTLIITGIVYIITQVLLFWFTYKFRQKKGRSVLHFAHSNQLEFIWTIIPAIAMTVLVVMGLKAWNNIFDSESRDTENMLVIEATAKQFNWTIRYPGPDGELGERIISSAYVSPENELGINYKNPSSQDDFFADTIFLVKDRPVLFQLGALDVLHGFYLPHFRVKMDCVPGMRTQFYFTPTRTTDEMREHLSNLGTWRGSDWTEEIQTDNGMKQKWEVFNYELACTELCGKSHYAMQKYVKVVEQEEYDQWLARQNSYYELVVKPTMASEEEPEKEENIEEEGEMDNSSNEEETEIAELVEEVQP